MRKVKTSSFSDDEPCYDTVASDEDYSSLGDAASVKDRNMVMDQVNDETEENHVVILIHQFHCAVRSVGEVLPVGSDLGLADNVR